MGLIQEIICILDHILLNPWDIQLLQHLLYTGNQTIQTNLNISTEPIMLSFINIFLVFTQKISKFQYPYTFNRIHKVDPPRSKPSLVLQWVNVY